MKTKTILTTEIFDSWFDALRDLQAKSRIKTRLRRAEDGNLVDCQPVGGGVSKLRIQ